MFPVLGPGRASAGLSPYTSGLIETVIPGLEVSPMKKEAIGRQFCHVEYDRRDRG
jgi:hypothetical protein